VFNLKTVKVIVSGHGTFATGLKGALHLLAKIPEDWEFVNFSEGMSDTQLKEQFEKLLPDDDQQVLFFTDLAGGTPYKVAATLVYSNSNYQLVTGCNLGSLLENIFNDTSSAEELAKNIVEVSKAGTQHFELNTPDDSQSPDSGDGI
jgi:PTS system N-acetylgalactosamine-specific IIA component